MTICWNKISYFYSHFKACLTIDVQFIERWKTLTLILIWRNSSNFIEMFSSCGRVSSSNFNQTWSSMIINTCLITETETWDQRSMPIIDKNRFCWMNNKNSSLRISNSCDCFKFFGSIFFLLKFHFIAQIISVYRWNSNELFNRLNVADQIG